MVAGILLTVFSFGITPRMLLHNWLAAHADFICKAEGSTKHIHNPEFSCHCDNMVAESPFTLPVSHAAAMPLPVFTRFTQAVPPALYIATFTLLSLRGPPAVS